MMVADIDERMPADEFLDWLRYLNGLRGSGRTPREMPKSLDGIRSVLGELGVMGAA